MYAVADVFDPSIHLQGPIEIDETTSYVSFKLNERYQRLCLWINQVNQSVFFFFQKFNFEWNPSIFLIFFFFNLEFPTTNGR